MLKKLKRRFNKRKDFIFMLNCIFFLVPFLFFAGYFIVAINFTDFDAGFSLSIFALNSLWVWELFIFNMKLLLSIDLLIMIIPYEIADIFNKLIKKTFFFFGDALKNVITFCGIFFFFLSGFFLLVLTFYQKIIYHLNIFGIKKLFNYNSSFISDLKNLDAEYLFSFLCVIFILIPIYIIILFIKKIKNKPDT